MKPVVFFHANDQHMLMARVGAHSLKSRSLNPEAFDVRILRLEETRQLCRRFNQKYYWSSNNQCVYVKSDSTAFCPLRRSVPQEMGYQGKALLLDSDIFAVGDIWELLSRDMLGKAILCRQKSLPKPGIPALYYSSVMVLDCAKLKHWQFDREIDDVFSGKLFMEWLLCLGYEPQENIGLVEEEWNHIDTLTDQTKLLHYSNRSVQPWKTGLPRKDAEYAERPPETLRESLRRVKAKVLGSENRPLHLSNPDREQERFFFSLLKECLDAGSITEREVKDEIRRKHIRKDTFQVLDSLNKENHLAQLKVSVPAGK